MNMAQYGLYFSILVLVLKGTQGLSTTANTSLSTTAKSSTHPSSAIPLKTATPLPTNGHFSLSKNGAKCLLLDLDCDVTVHFEGAKVEAITYHVPSNAAVSGFCESNGSSVAIVTLSWSVSNTSLYLTMGFHGSKAWTMYFVQFSANGNGKPLVVNGTDVVTETANDTFVEGSKGQSYLCEKKKTIELGKETVVTLNSIHIQPFSGDFGKKANNCEGSKKPSKPIDNVVPLAVGCVLAGLVVILVIAYCIGRRRGSGYETVN